MKRSKRSSILLGFTFPILIAGVWIAKSAIGVQLPVFDAPPFILLNLMLSTLAGLQGGILLIAAKRQDAISSAMAKNDHQSIELLKAEMEILKDINRKQTELLEAVYDHLGLQKKEALS